MPLTDPVPSNALDVLKRNAEDFDKVINSSLASVENRVGSAILTLAEYQRRTQSAIEEIVSDGDSAIQALRIETPFTFTEGGTLTAPNQVVLYTTDGRYYRWDGSFPKTVTAGTDPTADSTWVDVGQAALRSDLASSDADKGAVLVNGSTINTDDISSMLLVDAPIGAVISTKGGASPFDGGGADYEVVSGSTGTDDGFTLLDMNNGNQAKLLNKDTVKIEQSGVTSGSDSSLPSAIQAAADAGVSQLYISYQLINLGGNDIDLKGMTLIGNNTKFTNGTLSNGDQIDISRSTAITLSKILSLDRDWETKPKWNGL